MTFTKSDPAPIEGRGPRNTNLRNFKAHIKANPGEWWEYDQPVTYNVQAPQNSGYSFTVRSCGKDDTGRRIYRLWGRFDPVSSDNAPEAA